MASKSGELSNLDLKQIGWTVMLLLISTLVGWISTDFIPMLNELDSGWGIIAANLLTLGVAAVRQWLVDTRPTRDEHSEITRAGTKPKPKW